MTYVLASPRPAIVRAANRGDTRGILLYGTGSTRMPGLGRSLVESSLGLPAEVPTVVWDFLSIALAVFATDRFVVRDSAPDRWTRIITLDVEIADPEPWQSEIPAIASLLRFLTGDIWHIQLLPNGARPPKTRRRELRHDCASLFSGGLDSLVGALDLKVEGRLPLLVSQATPKEGEIQSRLASAIGLDGSRFVGKANERFSGPYEHSQRARSILFIAYGVLAAAALAASQGNRDVELVIPENGLISLNPPLTRRRLGSLSTRTTHPFFLHSLQEVFKNVGIAVRMVNPYHFVTKGEMLVNCAATDLKKLAPISYSCGKGKRINMQCGRCLPCLIRRAAFHSSGIADRTEYYADDLTQEASSDDVHAARMGSLLSKSDVERRVTLSGPLPNDKLIYDQFVNVAARGLAELGDFLASFKWQ
jgi:hypothetical protein